MSSCMYVYVCYVIMNLEEADADGLVQILPPPQTGTVSWFWPRTGPRPCLCIVVQQGVEFQFDFSDKSEYCSLLATATQDSTAKSYTFQEV